MLDLRTVTCANFAPLVGTCFRLEPDEGAAQELVLLQATEARATAGPRRAPFALLFRGPLAGWVPQRIYRLEHGQLGPLELFLVPVGPDEQGMRYEAIFN